MNDKQEYLYVSPSGKEIFEYDQQIGEKHPFLNIHPGDVVLLEDRFQQAIKDKKSYKVELKAMHVNKGWIWTELNGTPVFFDDNGKFKYMLLIARDISLQKENVDQFKY